MEEQDYLELVGKYLSDSISPEEEEQLMQWVTDAPSNQKFFEEMLKLWSLSEYYNQPDFEAGKEEAWFNITAKVGAVSKRVRLRSLRPLLGYAAAMLLVLAAGLYWVLNAPHRMADPPPATTFVKTKAGEQLEVILPDSSIVLLNENSVVAYQPDFEERHLTLKGEAFFEVAHHEDRPFSIEAGGATATVLGTSFNLRAYPEEEAVEVSVATGKVSVASPEEVKAPVLLEAGQSSVYDKQSKEVKVVELASANAWRTKELQFDNIRLGEVARVLERYFGLQIQFEDTALTECRYMGSFIEPSLEEVIETLSFTMDLEIKPNGGGIYRITGDATQCN